MRIINIFVHGAGIHYPRMECRSFKLELESSYMAQIPRIGIGQFGKSDG